MLRPVLLAALALSPLAALAEIQLNGVFADHMVLQREQPVPVWGSAAPGETVTVAFAAQRHTAHADATGKWRVNLTPLTASSTAQELVVKGSATAAPLTIRDILVGEVWLCAGQSNMEWALSKSTGGPEAIAAANNPLLRFCRVPHNVQFTPQASIALKWEAANPASVKNASAVPYWFGERLQRELGVPVGILNNSFGGTTIQSWLSAETLKAGPWPQDKWSVLATAKAEYDLRIAKWQAEKDAFAAAKRDQLPLPKDPGNRPSEFKGVSTLWNGEIVPLLPFRLGGIAWYQGENNAYANMSYRYRDLLAALIRDWRAGFGQPDLPFVVLQLSRFRDWQKDANEPSGIAEVREAQLQTVLATPRTALVVTLDQGEPDVHYPNKKPVAERTVLAALRLAYGRDVVASGPVFRDLKIAGGKALVRFDHADGGLVAKDGPLAGFALAGPDRVFHFADAVIKAGETVEVSCPQVPSPVAVRYGWADLPKVNLFNQAGLPASSFRTDAP